MWKKSKLLFKNKRAEAILLRVKSCRQRQPLCLTRNTACLFWCHAILFLTARCDLWRLLYIDFDQSGCAFVLNNEWCPDRSVNSQISIMKLGESRKRNLMIDLDFELSTCALSTNTTWASYFKISDTDFKISHISTWASYFKISHISILFTIYL